MQLFQRLVKFTQLYSKKNNLNYKILRLSNVFGFSIKTSIMVLLISLLEKLKKRANFLFNDTVKNYIFSGPRLFFWKLESMKNKLYSKYLSIIHFHLVEL